MAKKEALQRQAEMMFIELGYNAKAIAEQFGVQEKTVGNWRLKGDWDKQREELLASPMKVRAILLKEIQNLAAGGEATIDSDALSKVSKVMLTFNTKLSPQMVMTVLKVYDEWIANLNPELANLNLDFHKKFILHIINLYG
ncbi:terminase gpP N-terminus-related DNA-binding protein [Pedobacter sp. NJ-S-72]